MRSRFKRTVFIGSSLALTALLVPGIAAGQTTLPQITVETTNKKPPPKRTAVRRTPTGPATPAAAPAAPAQTPAQAVETANRPVVQQTQRLDERRDTVLLPKGAANQYQLSQQDLEAIPQGSAVQISDLVLQFPGVYQDSTSQGDFHVRNEHGNVQYRINGIVLPDGVSGFSQILETGFIKNMSLLTGALPAQYGLRTSGIIDITAKSGAALSGGTYGVYGGSHDTISPFFEYGGVTGQTEYFAAGRFQSTGLGLENPISSVEAIHDISKQGRLFTYTSTLLDPNTRFVTIAGVAESRFQIPNNPGQPGNAGGFTTGSPCPSGYTAFGFCDFNSANINQNQYEKNAYAVAAWQHSEGDLDVQLAYYSRYSDLHFVPDPIGDLFENNVASDVFRSSFLNGINGDVSYRLNDWHTLRAGFYTNAEYTQVRNLDIVQPVDPATGNAIDTPFGILDASNKMGYQLGAYIGDEFRFTDKITFNYGLRFDQMFQYVDANQVSPRASVVYKPWWGTVLHAGYAREFTPPAQVLGRTIPTQLFDGTTAAAALQNVGQIQPERADVYDVGIVQQLLPQCPTLPPPSGLPTKAPVVAPNCPSLEVGVTAYYKHAKDLIDDGQFGQAYTLTAFNYAYGENVGTELTARFRYGNFSFDTAWAVARQIATDVVSNQSLFASTDDLALDHWRHTDHDQLVTGSARAAYRWKDTHSWWDGTVLSATAIYGSGLRRGFDNAEHLPAYYQINLGASHEFVPPPGWFINDLPITVRFDVVNVTDKVYEIRDGTGVGVFAPQFGPRRGYFIGLSQKLGDPRATQASMPTKAPPMYDWTGAYVGAHFGGAFTIHDAAIDGVLSGPMRNGADSSGALGGFQAGYNWHFAPHWLAGIEGEISWSSVEARTNFIDTATAVSYATNHNKSYETLAGRLGYVWGPLLTYAKLGGAWTNIHYELAAGGGVNGSATVDANRSGWTFGTGIEYKLSPRWSAKAEYSFLDFGTDTVGTSLLVAGDSLTVKDQIHEVKAGVNYHWLP